MERRNIILICRGRWRCKIVCEAAGGLKLRALARACRRSCTCTRTRRARISLYPGRALSSRDTTKLARLANENYVLTLLFQKRKRNYVPTLSKKKYVVLATCTSPSVSSHKLLHGLLRPSTGWLKTGAGFSLLDLGASANYCNNRC